MEGAKQANTHTMPLPHPQNKSHKNEIEQYILHHHHILHNRLTARIQAKAALQQEFETWKAVKSSEPMSFTSPNPLSILLPANSRPTWSHSTCVGTTPTSTISADRRGENPWLPACPTLILNDGYVAGSNDAQQEQSILAILLYIHSKNFEFRRSDIINFAC